MQRSFYYQPNLYSSIIFWSWTFVILFVSGTGWLEITTIQWFTIVTFILFLVIAALGVFRRRLTLDTENSSLILQQILPRHNRSIKFNELQHVVVTTHGVRFELTRLPHVTILMTKNQKQKLVAALDELRTTATSRQP
ncbi:EbsA family protein [Loigolactobacillus zhaoyuanensis]|uniref:EbsA family protein n=1 Tax=Loigolactobacillus zhaoyuanensis TaxID=2486017 RepID=A0ABW8UCB7_9LACO|nr:EbsA family protein [Loigolactobacillus zhaoyuanensis]